MAAKRNPILSVIRDMIYHGLETFGRYYSSYRGFVVDNDDPLKLGRVKLLIPEVGQNTPYEYWAYPKGIFSGSGYGMQIIPQKQEMVWVEFEAGHPEVPIYSLGHFGANEAPTNLEDLDDVNCYWFITPYGHNVRLNDTKKYISINTGGGHNIGLDDENNVIKIKHKDGQYLEILKSSVSLVSDKSISLGTLDGSSQKAMLGDKTKSLLTDLKDFCDELTKSLTTDTATLSPYAPATIAALPQLIEKVTSVTTKLDGILSDINTLD